MARVVLTARYATVRAGGPAETWRILVRPHLAVRRTFFPSLLALLADHTVARRGVHAGTRPLHWNGLPDAPTDWLAALDYPLAPPWRGPHDLSSVKYD